MATKTAAWMLGLKSEVIGGHLYLPYGLIDIHSL